jgi:uncharacterized protein
MPADSETKILRHAGFWFFLLRIIIPIGILAAGLMAFATLVDDGDPTEVSTLFWRIVSGVVASLAVIVTIVVLARLTESPPLRAIDFTSIGDLLRGFGTGAVVWLLPAGMMFTVFVFFGAPLTVTGSVVELAQIVFLLFLAVLLSEAIPEELVFRGYITNVLGERFSGWWVIIIQTALFIGFILLLRGYPGSIDFSLFVSMGVVFGYLRMITGSVWTTVGFHAAFQTGSQLIFTHEVVDFAGSSEVVMLALGAVPFTVAAILVSFIVPAWPWLIARQR